MELFGFWHCVVRIKFKSVVNGKILQVEETRLSILKHNEGMDRRMSKVNNHQSFNVEVYYLLLVFFQNL